MLLGPAGSLPWRLDCLDSTRRIDGVVDRRRRRAMRVARIVQEVAHFVASDLAELVILVLQPIAAGHPDEIYDLVATVFQRRDRIAGKRRYGEHHRNRAFATECGDGGEDSG